MIAARFSPGAISESSSSHLPASVASKRAKPVTFPRGRSSRDGIAHVRKDDRDRPRRPQGGNAVCQDDVGLQADQLLRERSHPINVTAGPTKVHPHVVAIRPTQARRRLRERRGAMKILLLWRIR